ncbi:hypothetical protein B0A55_03496 [Friedmanniomyces simplex]|uniref:Uncharacterized protein n=1 Tax=Friedmanniomyces simplex TaxID=329884 RepID=A0A4U0XPN3_9PEZI|nr:hypothetical protein B0A55_03496 [Friedmanniomyces simplex]
MGFFNLPAQLRNHIYELALVPSDAVRPTEIENDPPATTPLAACPRIRSEAEQIFWRQNTFHFNRNIEALLAGAPEASRWMFAVGWKRIRYVKSLIITYKTRFSLELGRSPINGKPALVLESLAMAKDKPWDPFATMVQQQALQFRIAESLRVVDEFKYW